MSPEEIASYEVLDEYQAPFKTWCIPFAVSARRDEWAWRTDWMSDNQPKVVLCERGPEGYGFALLIAV